jgi:hypothetical protein
VTWSERLQVAAACLVALALIGLGMWLTDRSSQEPRRELREEQR